MGAARPIDGRPFDHVNINDEELQVVDTLCCLNDMVSDGGRCESAIITLAHILNSENYYLFCLIKVYR